MGRNAAASLAVQEWPNEGKCMRPLAFAIPDRALNDAAVGVGENYSSVPDLSISWRSWHRPRPSEVADRCRHRRIIGVNREGVGSDPVVQPASYSAGGRLEFCFKLEARRVGLPILTASQPFRAIVGRWRCSGSGCLGVPGLVISASSATACCYGNRQTGNDKQRSSTRGCELHASMLSTYAGAKLPENHGVAGSIPPSALLKSGDLGRLQT